MDLRKGFALAIAAVWGIGCGNSTGVTVADLEGTWNATQYIYTNDANPAEQVDLVTAGASFVMTVTSDATVSSLFTDTGGGTSSDSGTLNPDGSTLTIAGVGYEAERNGDRLTLINQTSAYDFDGDGSDDPATLEIRLQR